MAKIDPTRKARRAASLISRANPNVKCFINFNGEKYTVSNTQGTESVMCYKNGSEICL